MRSPAHRIAYIALFAAFMAVCAQICLPFAVPFTMQTFAMLLSLLLLGKDAVTAIAVYIIIGAVGAPVFSGFMGGMGVLAGATGGYIFGFLLSALVYRLVIRLFGDQSIPRVIGCIMALLTCYLTGMLWYSYVSGTMLWHAFLTGVLPYLLPDIAKLLLALWLSKRLLRCGGNINM